MPNKTYKELLPHEVLERIKQKENVTILDVRDHDEWESGHIYGAKHIPLSQIARALNEIKPKQETIIVCRSGNRSGMACDYLSSMGYHVTNMTGGMSEWSGEVEYGK
ncbi:rhodanese-like domain-containing protein [Paenibacillus alginolyticus]|uniref:Rhodanese-like domain-containing protein n=1 Tax=Paenibacillus alginolyticus TaxID=59839 RepID=A0ABT4G5T5_9BACL|nr:rhodanese-like domain-containing protein [Paenibacillus alginolyticus]MCY9669937.1 rhodanese-like domain-containing protein [Paenibacillus alginolyticus]MCY9691526.1 rhodanese-like domain-containing protein [Paenibacillus alginolyticus]MEC0148321.1 rhodanese-like domain-containing protein [Paenibacillus alginolyticus]